MEIRDKILSAAARVYSQHGFRGATTRLIAQEADVNEVTLFRTFGSKEALIEEAIRFHSESAEFARLPEEPDDPERELGEWCEAHIAHIRRRRPLIVSCMADIDERPEVACGAARGADRAWGELHRYLERLKERGLMDPSINTRAAGSMFMGAAFGDAMGREMITEMFPQPADAAPHEYTKLFLRMIAPSTTPTSRHNGRGAATRTTTGDHR
jgi:AcrR family transcriptional regulator